MKKPVKIVLISLASLVGLVLLVAVVAMWIVFTPARLTSIVRKQAPRFLTCETHVGRAELTFFSTFPNLSLKADGLTLINPVEGAPSDTLLDVRTLTAGVDVMALWRRNELILRGFELTGGTACIFTDSTGRTNYDVFRADNSVPEEEDGGFTLAYADIGKVALRELRLTYADRQAGVEAAIDEISLSVNGKMRGDAVDGALDGTVSGITAAVGGISATVDEVMLTGRADMAGKIARADMKASARGLSFTMDTVRWADGVDVAAQMSGTIDLNEMRVELQPLTASVNGLRLNLEGMVAAGSDGSGRMSVDLAYSADGWMLEEILRLIPAAYADYLDGVEELKGVVALKGTARGPVGDSVMPLIDARLLLERGELRYADLPFPLSGMTADVNIHTDLADDEISYVSINDIRVATPASSLWLTGRVRNLFSDMGITAQAGGDFSVDELSALIPDSLGVSASGRMAAEMTADLTMSQLENMELERMKISGKMLLTQFDAAYDTIRVSTPGTSVDFALPNEGGGSRRFIRADITSERLSASMGNQARAELNNARLTAETSNIMDTTRIPALLLALETEGFAAAMDSMSVSITNPRATVSLAPARRSESMPRFSVTYASGDLAAGFAGDDYALEKIELKATVVYDEKADNIFSRWNPRGSLDAENIRAGMAALAYPVEVPAIQMDFSPSQFNIWRANVVLGDSDFSLTGNLDNLVSYVRGDSLLRGEFAFISDNTDISQLMSLTSGFGYDAQTDQAGTGAVLGVSDIIPIETQRTDAAEIDGGFTGPYMVPKGVDILLRANISQARFNADTIKNIAGDVYLRDGEMVLDTMRLSLPGADAQLRAIYRPERRNHLFAGVDLHLIRVEIGTLLHMIPDLDEMMPMLRSFSGQGEFHLAAETYVDSLYSPKISTLRAAASIRGEDLMIKDTETFGQIAKYLRYLDREAWNRVDSLSAEFTIFRDEIDVYPFLISLGKWKAVVGGRHNLDMSFDYNISLVESPLPFRTAVDVYGTPDDLKFKLFRKSKYPEFYRPVSRRMVENEQMNIRQLIREALLRSLSRSGDGDPDSAGEQ